MSEFSYLPFSVRGDYIAGGFVQHEPADGVIVSRNPGAPDDVVGEFGYRAEAIDEAIDAAQKAFLEWRATPFETRAALLERYAEALETNRERLAQAISREMGKVLWEARTEVAAMIRKVAITLEDGMRLVADVQPQGVPGWIRHYPRGVMVVIGPFNFPGHLPNGHIVPALATGNTVVFKTASSTPAVGQIMAECIDAAGFPAGVFNLVQVPGRLADRLVAHPDVDGVLFTGSTAVGERIKELTLKQHHKICALEMGGKNAAIVLDDAPFELALYEVLTGAFLTSGQRCTATSRVIVGRAIADRFAERLAAATKRVRVSVQHDPDAFMGPMVDRRAAEDFHRWQGIATQEGAECLAAGGLVDERANKAYVRPSLHRVAAADHNSRYQREELFAPDCCVYTVDSLEEAIALADDTEYGLACSVFTSRRESYLEVLRGVRAGVINWNRSTVGASSKLPFGGLKKSGNGHPAAVYSTLYCTYPVASLEEDKPFDPSALLPGLSL